MGSLFRCKRGPEKMGKQDRDMRLLEQVGKAKERDMRPSTKQRSLYLAMALFTVLAPLPIFGLDLQANLLVIVLSALIVTFGYHNTFFSVKTRLMIKRDSSKSSGSRDEQVTNTVWEATAFSVLFNNCIFLLAASSGAFFVFSAANNVTSYVLSVSSGAAVATLMTASQLDK